MADAEVVDFPGVTRLDLPVEKILDRARDADLTEILILGYDKDGDFYFVSSMADGGYALWLMEIARVRLLQAGRVIPKFVG